MIPPPARRQWQWKASQAEPSVSGNNSSKRPPPPLPAAERLLTPQRKSRHSNKGVTMKSGSPDGRFRTHRCSADVSRLQRTLSTRSTWHVAHVAMRLKTERKKKKKKNSLKNNLRVSHWPKTDGNITGETHASARTGNVSPLWRNRRSVSDFHNPKCR